jgi:hypothetical protein
LRCNDDVARPPWQQSKVAKLVSVLLVPVAMAATLVACSSTESESSQTIDRSDGGVATSASSASAAPLATVPTTTTAIPLTGCSPFYTASVTIGGTQTFQLALDSASTTLAVAGDACADCADAGIAPRYTPGTAAVDTHVASSSTYNVGDIGWTGEVYSDEVNVGGVGAKTKLAMMKSAGGLFTTGWPCPMGQGILGLGTTAVERPGTNGYFDEAVAAGTPNVFAVELCKSHGNLWLGGWDPSSALGPAQFTPIVPNDFYSVHLADVKVSGNSVAVAASAYGNRTVMLDTGGPLFSLTTPVFDALTAALAADPAFAKLVGDASWFTTATTCLSLPQTRAELDATLPSVTLVLGADAASQVEMHATATTSYLIGYESGGQTVWCPGIAALPPSLGWDVVGDMGGAILQSNILVFDRANKRLGIAPHAQCD